MKAYFKVGRIQHRLPLEFFLAGLVGCLMTQIRVFSTRLEIELSELTVNCSS
jgi:uncharacterized OsmC-like protein